MTTVGGIGHYAAFFMELKPVGHNKGLRTMLRFLKILRTCLLVSGGISLLLGLLAGAAALLTEIERLQRGHGLLFADAEAFGLLALICCTLGAFSLIVGKRIARQIHKLET